MCLSRLFSARCCIHELILDPVVEVPVEVWLLRQPMFVLRTLLQGT